jgi:hypothetical protein
MISEQCPLPEAYLIKINKLLNANVYKAVKIKAEKYYVYIT